MGCATSKRSSCWSSRRSISLPPRSRSTRFDDEVLARFDGHRIVIHPTTIRGFLDLDGPGTPSFRRTASPETINAWELMAGLKDDSTDDDDEARKLAYDIDPDVHSSFQKTLEELPEKISAEDRDFVGRKTPDFTGIVRARIVEFQERIDAKKKKAAEAAKPTKGTGGRLDGKVVLFFTTIRAIRRTFEDCVEVRSILSGYSGVTVDERDVSMHSGYREELEELLEEHGDGRRRLPAVFVDGRYLGGMKTVKALHEDGQLAKELAIAGAGGNGCCDDGAGGGVGPCRGCGDVRFVPCGGCSGSCKVFVEEEFAAAGGGGFWWRCPDCNENGIVRCPICC